MKKFYFSILALLLFQFTLLAAAPTTPATNAYTSIIEGSYLNLGWTNGNGAKRIVIVKAGSPITGMPVNGVDYTENANFGNGDVIAPGEYVVHDGNAGSFYLNNLTPATTYYIAIFDYNGSGFSTEYLQTPLRANFSTVAVPTIQTTSFIVAGITANSAALSWTAGNGGRRLILIREGSAVNANPVDLVSYSSNASFGAGTGPGTGNYTIYRNTGNSGTVNNLKAGTTYHIAVYEFNGNGAPVYLAPALTATFTTSSIPTFPSSNIYTSTADGQELFMRWAAGNGSKRIMIIKKGSAVTAVPADGIDYMENAAYGSGQEIAPGEFVVYDNNLAEINITTLDGYSTYYFRVFDYVGTGSSIRYLTSSFASGSGNTAIAPTMSPSGINASIIKADYMYLGTSPGNGAGRLMLVKKGSPVDAVPQDFVKYSTVQTYGTGTELGTGNFIISGNNLAGLEPNTTYHFASFEFNGSKQPVYRSIPARYSATTLARPTQPATQMYVPAVEGNYLRVSWQNGNGSNRILVAKKGSVVTGVPADNTTYTASSTFGNGQTIAPGEFVVFNGTNSVQDVIELEPGTTYYFSEFEYNVVNNQPLYLVTTSTSTNATTLRAPTIQAGMINASNITMSSMTLSWSAGNGNGRILVARAGQPVNADPADFNTYAASTTFGSGNITGTGNYVLITGSANTVAITGLQAGATYHFALYEYNGRSAPVYLKPAYTTSIATAADVQTPTTPASAMLFGTQEGNTMNIRWTNGNGAKRIVIARANTAVTATPADGQAYTANGIFAMGQDLGGGQYVIADGNNSSVELTGLTKNSNYHFAVFEYNGTAATTKYLRSLKLSGNSATAAAPTVSASAISFTGLTPVQATINWTNGNGANRLVVVRAGTPVNASPADLTRYQANVAYGNGAEIGTGNYVVYTNDQSSVTVNNLVSGITYYVAIFEYNGLNTPVYSISPVTSSFKTVGAPQTPASAINFTQVGGTTVQLNWTSGDGQRRLILARKNNAVNATPADNTSYTGNSAFGSGQLLGADNYVVYSGTGNSVAITNLEAFSNYHFAVFEYNDFGNGIIRYLTTTPASGNITTTGALPVKLSSFTVTLQNSVITLNWITDMEINSRHFIIERSADGIDFYPVSRINAAGNAARPTSYQAADPHPLTGKNYYRLQMIDLDGKAAYSSVVFINYFYTTAMRISPNPSMSAITITLPADTDLAKSAWFIYNNQGQVLRTGKAVDAVFNLSVEQLKPGMYWFRVMSNNKIINTSFIKQ